MVNASMVMQIVGVETTDRNVLDSVRRAARALNLNIELLSTEHACSTFNFLNAEGRSVAGAFIPPMSLVPDEDDMLESQMVYQDVFNWQQKKQ
ncbi:NADH dehydrogenase 1 alpha subcomplex assembly factor 3 [Eumeta japonica]|uniref:NADH dehydrogenase 1 alpha subcomplex assembly factor 3 n=1 Tax=Eumeta variegata TaxID=151549 RepID=A0A4C1X0U4_EUMVA|nr:NADH dehydrogenase 1 alpha subcomplex assembly factor 3 [Eumeta japonica]